MYVRLAFAVAAHLEPEILVVDEVLAVGDADFQKKCLGKMKDVSVNEGRTVLFVSHNMAAVRSLCSHGIVLSNGKMIFDGNEKQSITYYQNETLIDFSYEEDKKLTKIIGNENIRVIKFGVTPLTGDIISVSSGFIFKLKFHNNNPNCNLDVTFELKNLDEIVVFHHGAILTSNQDSKVGIYSIQGSIPGYLINAGIYKFSIIFGYNQRYVLFQTVDLIKFEISNESFGSNSNQLPGVLRFDIPYKIDFT